MNDDIWRQNEAESPCVNVCVIHPEAGICVGCYRTMHEITCWGQMSTEARRSVVAELSDRASLLQRRRGGRAARLGRRAEE